MTTNVKLRELLAETDKMLRVQAFMMDLLLEAQLRRALNVGIWYVFIERIPWKFYIVVCKLMNLRKDRSGNYNVKTRNGGPRNYYLNDMSENASMIASLDRKIPLIADADTGYGGEILTDCCILFMLTFAGRWWSVEQ
jgi:hypothetical protein